MAGWLKTAGIFTAGVAVGLACLVSLWLAAFIAVAAFVLRDA